MLDPSHPLLPKIQVAAKPRAFCVGLPASQRQAPTPPAGGIDIPTNIVILRISRSQTREFLLKIDSARSCVVVIATIAHIPPDIGLMYQVDPVCS
jgi:hypothetical protein